MRKKVVILMILMFALSLNAQENEFIRIKNSLSKKWSLKNIPSAKTLNYPDPHLHYLKKFV